MATATLAPGRSSERRFYTGMAAAMLLTVLVGFSRSFFLRPLFPGWPSPSEPAFYVHGAAFAAWPVLLLAQAWLVSAGRTAVHRGLGACGVALAATMVALGVYASILAAQRPSGFVGVAVPPLVFLAVPLTDMALFGAFVAQAVVRRRDVQAHKRWMLLASMNLMTAAVGRFPGISAVQNPFAFFLLSDLFLVALVAWDLRSRGRLHPVTLWGGAAYLLSQPARVAVSGTGAWLSFARWLAGID